MPGTLPATEPSYRPTSAQLEQAFAWFDRLGFPSTRGRRLVNVATGRDDWSTDPPEKEFVRGFLLDEKGDTFVVLTLGLETMELTNTPPQTEPRRQVYYRKLDLRKAAESVLDALAAGKAREEVFRLHGLGDEGCAFVLARHCARHGHTDLASRLCASLVNGTEVGADADNPVREAVEHTFEWFMRRRAYDAQGDPRVSRREELQRFRDYARCFPAAAGEKCKEHIALLERMVQEEEAHRRRDTPPLAELPKEERIAELIWRLRYQTGQKWSNPGTINFFADYDPEDPNEPRSPACQLRDIGLDAVPQLVDAMTNTRFTQAMDPDWGQHYRVGDCAWVILQAIAARDFGWDQTKTVAEVDEETLAAAQADVRQWLAEFKKRGEREMLIEGTATGDDSSPRQAVRLLEKYPDAALEPLTEGARKAHGWNRRRLVDFAADLPGDQPVPFLLEEMKTGEARATAATALLKRGRPEVVPALLAWWNKAKTDMPPADLIELLASCGDPRAVRALGRDFDTLPVASRFAILRALGPRADSGRFVRAGGQDEALAEDGSRKEAVETAAQDVLVGALDDTEAYWGCAGGWYGQGFADPRICDMAGLVLSMRWPDKYRFDMGASLFERNVACVALKNVWRKAHGLDALPLPEWPKPPEVAPEATRPLFAQLEAARTDSERRRALAAIETHGLLALPHVLRHLDGLERQAPASTALEDLARRLACIVEEAAFTKASLPAPEALREAVKALEGKRLTADAFAGVVDGVVDALPAEAMGVRVEAVRRAKGRGVVLTVCLLGPDYQPPGSPWTYDGRVEIDGKYVGGEMGASRRVSYKGASHEDFIAAVAKALDARATQRFRIVVTIGRAKQK
ncbi:MAG: hypothetical protein R6X20_19040 [Phycisphaerae bacterium]